MARKLEVEIIGDASSLRRAVGQADQSTGKLGGTFGKLAKGGALAAGAAGVGALIYTLKTGISEFSESQKVAAQTNAVIKSTGGAANVTAKHVDELATSLMKKSGVDDEVIKSGENMLLTFKNIRNEAGKGNDIFDQSTKILTDMSVALGEDPSKAAIRLGKALNDPVKGITALSRVGVTFTEGQKKQIKSLVDSGQTMKAQKIILKELNSEFGGSAEAVGKTLPGQINILKQEFNNFAGDLVAKTIPILQQTIAWLRDHWPEIRTSFLNMWAAVQPALVSFGELVGTVAGLIQKHWGTIGPIVQTVASIIKTSLQQITAIIRVFTAILRGDWSAAWKGVKDIASNAVNLVTQLLKLWVSTVGALAKRAGIEIKNGVVAGLQALPGAAWAAISALGGFLAGKAKQIAGWGVSLGLHLLSGIKSALTGIGAYVVNLIRSAINSLIDRFNRAVELDLKIKGVGLHINPPDVPHLAEGGIITSPTLAVVGDKGPEAVVPLNGRSGMLQPIILQVDGKTLAQVMYDPFRNVVVQKSRGGAVFA